MLFDSHRITGKTTRVINMGSYNYLGFGECSGPCTDAAENSIKDCGVGSCSTRLETGIYTFFFYK